MRNGKEEYSVRLLYDLEGKEVRTPEPECCPGSYMKGITTDFELNFYLPLSPKSLWFCRKNYQKESDFVVTVRNGDWIFKFRFTGKIRKKYRKAGRICIAVRISSPIVKNCETN